MWPISQETADLVTFTEEILNGKIHFLCSDISFVKQLMVIKIYFVKTCQQFLICKNVFD